MTNNKGQTFIICCLLVLQIIASTSSISDFNLEFSDGLEVKASDTEQLTINSNSSVNDNCPYFLTMSEVLGQGCANPVEVCPAHLTPAEVVALGCSEDEVAASSLLESHSMGVQRAFRLSSDLTKYTSEELLETKDWFVITNLDESVHFYQSEGPDKIRPTLGDGFYIWSYEEPSIAKESLEEMYKSGLIEGFHPLIDMQAMPEFTPNDPLFANQWHLVNTAQIGGSAVAGEDVNITSVWDDYDGTGIIISIVDDGINSSHPDLSTNWNSVVSYDWCNSDSDPSHTITKEYHGTAVAGVAAATGNNNIDVTGAAFGATISAQKIMGSPCNSGWTDGDVLGFSNTIIDIYQNSWGYSTPYYQSVTTPVESGIESSITNGRGGLGSIIVFSAGNGLTEGSNSNNGDLPNSRYTIAVSAITDSGEQSPYSEPGTNILLAAYSNGGQIGILTTDPTGTWGKPGMNSTNGNFGGTSSAAPLVSGIIALMLEANENLTWRDVQHILVNSAKKNDANDSSWIINGAGHDVSEKFGFGAIDAGAAVNKALNWQSVDIEDTSSYGPFTTVKTIADPTSLCQITVYSTSSDSDGDTYEDEECTFNLPSGETLELDLRLPDIFANDLGVKLTEPSGTQTIWQPGYFVNTNTSGPMQSQNNSLLNARLINLGSYTTSGTYTLQIYDSYGDGCPGFSAFTYQISCEIFATYGSDWTESTVTISGGINSLETVELEVDIDHTNRSNLDIVLVSPSGTESWLAKKYHDGNGVPDLNWKFSSVHHWDEYSDGTWTLKIRDVVSGDTGTLNSWSLNIYGTNNSQNSCLAGTYQPTGQSSCIAASAGYYATSLLEDGFESGDLYGLFDNWSGDFSNSYCDTTVDSSCSWVVSNYSSLAGNYSLSIGSANGYLSNAMHRVISSSIYLSTDSNFTFSYRVSTENAWDKLIFCLDADNYTCGSDYAYGSEPGWSYNQSGVGPNSNSSQNFVRAWSGIQSGNFTIDLAAGYHTLHWSFSKDSAVGANEDSAWLDNFSISSLTGSISQTECSPGNYQNLSGQSSCIDASAGYYVDTTASTTQTACAAGTYQPSTGQSSCIDADAGYYVPSTGSATQTACAAGTYQANTGQSSCIDASAGYYAGAPYSFGGDFENGAFTSTWQTSSLATYPMTVDSGSPISGVYSAMSTNQNIGSSASGMMLSLTNMVNDTDTDGDGIADAASYSFAYSVSSESGWDFLVFCIDNDANCLRTSGYEMRWAGVLNGVYSGTVDAGAHTFTWNYWKDGAVSSNADTAWIDDVTVSAPIPLTPPANLNTSGSTMQTACAAGTYQPSIGQSSCIVASAGYYVNTSGSTIQTECTVGTYQPSTGQSSCIDASAGYYVSNPGSTNQTACTPGTYNPYTASMNSTSCISTSAGYFANEGSANQTACAVGTYQPSTGQSSCIDASTGYYVSNSGSTNQTACGVGTYQPSPGQSSCLDSSPGYYVPNIGSSNQLICNSGTYQPNYGQSSCIDSSPGYYVSNSGQTTQSACVEGTYQPNYGQSSCIDSSPGYYVDNTAMSNQTACPGGTFNPNHGSVSSNDCIITSPGYYSSSGSGSQNPCQGGTYQSLAGQTNCTSTDPGYYVPGISYAFQISCNPGTYQPNSGSSDCLIADAGYYVDSYSSVTQTACPAGTFNPINGSSTYSSCIDTSPGYFTPVSGMSEEYPCNPGTYQPLGGQDNCTNSSPGHFVPMNASTTQEPCIIGMYQPNYGRTYCEYPSSGYYVPTSSSSNQTRAEPGHYANANDNDTTTSHPCPLGSYQPYSGQSECIEADSGFYVDDNGSLEQIPCIGGTYNPNNGSISSDSCIDSIPGHYSKDGYSTYVSCELGSYQPNSGQSSCIESEPGFYVENNGSIDQIPCIEGTYNPNFGADSQDYCVQSNPGYHVPSPGSANQIPCIKGTYQPNFGESNCIPASLGYYVPVEGSISQIAADLDYYVDYTGSFTTSQCPEFYLTLETGSKTIDECLLDTDLDRNPNIFDEDDDNDNILDVNDFCPAGQIDWISGFVNDQDIDGCKDSGEDLDDDNDGRLDENDAFPYDSFEQDDNDLDGLGDNLDIDDDNDGLSDILEYDLGTDQFDADTDGDGFADKIDHFPLDGSEWVDTDGDGVGDNSDFMKTISSYQTQNQLILHLLIIAALAIVVTMFTRSKSQELEENSATSDEE